MNDLFLKIINMSISASWVVLAVLLLRLVLKKAPKWINVLLWGIVAVRLICPFSFESALSLIPSSKTIPLDIEMAVNPAIDSGVPAINRVVNPVLSSFAPPQNILTSANPLQIWIPIFSIIWLVGVAALLLYTVVSYWQLHRRIATAIRYQDNIYQSENVSSPFVLGIIKPRIYLPFNMNDQNLEHVVSHEQAHIRRKDHWWKPLGFLLLMIHWFNPLMWLAYVLLCRDIELACDEKVIKELGNEQRADYTQALVACSVNRRIIAACPLAFGEVGVKERVKSVMNYKKPTFWVIVLAVIACVVVAICFLTNPVSIKNYIRLQSTHSTPPAAFFSLELAEEDTQGTVIAERWENGKCISTNPVLINPLTQQIQLYLDLGENGVNVQLGVENGDTVMENFSYPEGKQPAGWSFASLKEGEKEPLRLGEDRIIATMALDFGTGVESYSCESLSADEKRVENAAYLIVIRVFLQNDNDLDTPNAERPTLIMDGKAYVDPYMPISSLPYGYQSAGKVTDEQANNTGLEGMEYFVHPSETEDFYTYQECGTPISIDTVDSTKRQWAYVRWILVTNDAIENWKLTLDDVILLSKKGDALTWSDFERYQGDDVGSGLYIMRYEIDELFDVLVGGVPDETPMYIKLRVNNEAEDSIDIRTENVSTFIEAHRNDVPKVVEPKPDGGGEPAPEEPDFPSLSEDTIRQAILEHNRSTSAINISADPDSSIPCASFVELACIVEDGSDFSEYTHYGWALYEEYRVTDNGLETIIGSHVPVAITFQEDPSGTLTLEEYWEPRDGSYYAQDIRDKFPAHIAEDGMDSQKFVLQQTQECYAQAVEIAGLDTEKVIETLLETICSSPAQSSNPGDYVEKHPIEYRELKYYGTYTLHYCFTEFLKGGQTDLRGRLMRIVLDELSPEARMRLYTKTGQEYFDEWKAEAIRTGEQHDMDWIKANQPAVWLLLQMIDEQ